MTLCNSSCLLLSSHHKSCLLQLLSQKVQMEFCRRAICRDGRCFCSLDLAESIVCVIIAACLEGSVLKNHLSQCSPLEPGQSSLFSSPTVDQLLFRVTSARREGPCTELEFASSDLVVPVGVGSHLFLVARIPQ